VWWHSVEQLLLLPWGGEWSGVGESVGVYVSEPVAPDDGIQPSDPHLAARIPP
jgi:hypothetical protein